MTLFEEHIQDVFILPREIRVCLKNAQQAEIGGQSNIREGEQREAALSVDQLVGQLGEYALSVYMTGDATEYHRQRMVANNYSAHGDLGQDFLGLNVDIKTSAMRSSTNPLDYTLAVRPKELHDNWCYVLALVQPNGQNGLVPTMTIRVRLVGWLHSEELPKQPEKYGTFKGAHIMTAQNLHALPNFRWLWRSE